MALPHCYTINVSITRNRIRELKQHADTDYVTVRQKAAHCDYLSTYTKTKSTLMSS